MKRIKKHLPLWIYLSIAFLGLSLILIIIMWLFQTVFFDNFYRGVKTFQTQRCAYSVVYNIENEKLSEMLADIEEHNDMNISVYGVTEYNDNPIFSPIYTPHKIFSSHSFANMNSVYELYYKALEDGGEVIEKCEKEHIKKPRGFDLEFEPPLDREASQFLTCAVITQTDQSQYFVLVESDISPVTSTVDTIRVQLVIMTVVMVLVNLFTAIITARSLSKPLQDTNRNAKQLALHNYDIAFSGGGYKELCELNDTLNYSAHELQKVDELRRELIANISHDLRTPLTMITGYSEVMRDIPGENSPENIQIIIDEANHLSSLVNDLLDISKLESGTVTMENSVFCLTECVKSMFKRYTKLIEQDGYNIVFEYDKDAYIEADPLRMSQVMYNLINNAINYAGENKTVIVKQSVGPNSVCIEVIDYGVGIEEDKIPYIWDRYYKVDKEHKMAVVGTGLGLSIVKNILNHYDAQYGVKSTLGFGSDFWFIFPTVENE